ncbi:MAG: sugar-binding protein [Deltaproteobacteria bacterium]|nr:sugar-binding protein [Deltaproteobacteria bacterium]MBI3390859.1 sugar-binding protein [Deltaproteobacteria bacterium]
MRKTLALCSILFLSFACSNPSDQPRKLRFAIIPKAIHIPVFEYARIGAERMAKELGVEVLWRGAETTDEIRQKEILESFISQRVDGIAISCLNGDLLTDAINRAVDAGIPVITWDSDAPKSKRLAFYGVNDIEGGRALGDGLAKLLGGKGRVALITSLGADNLQKRLEGAQAALKQYPDITVVETFDVRDDAVRVAEVIASATQRYPDLDGWLSVGGWPVFVRNALDPVDPARTKVVAFDTIPPAPDLLRAGKVQLLVGQKYFGWGEESVRLLKQITDGQRPTEVYHYSGIDVVTRDNVDAYLEQWKQWEAGR